MPSWHPASASAGCEHQTPAAADADAATSNTASTSPDQAADSSGEPVRISRQAPQPPPAANFMPAAADGRPPPGAMPVPRSWQRHAQLYGGSTGSVGTLASAFSRLPEPPSGSISAGVNLAARGGGGSSGRTSLLSQQLRCSDSAGESAGNSSADSSPLQQSVLRGAQPPRRQRPHSRHAHAADGAADPPLQRRFTMRSALSAELAGLRADLQQQPLQGAQPAAATAGAWLMDAGRSSSTPLPLLPSVCPQVGVAALSAASAPFQGWPIGHATPPSRRTSQERQASRAPAAPPPPPRPRSMRSHSSPAASPHDPDDPASPSSGHSSPAAPRAREPIAVPGAPVSPPGQWMLGRVPSGSNIRVSFESEDDDDNDSSTGGLSM